MKHSTLEHPPPVLGNKDCTDFTKCNTRFVKTTCLSKSDIQSCRCKNFSLKQASGPIWGVWGVRTPPIPIRPDTQICRWLRTLNSTVF